MTENERLSMDEVIAHCNRRVEMYESFSSRKKCENWSLDSQYGKSYWEHRQVAKWLEELKVYRAIGTIDEFKALKEKNTPYKPKEYEDRYYACKCDNILLPKWEKYPTKLMPKSEGLPHCMACGQKLDWGE